MLSGPPGIGKTTAAKVISEYLKFSYVVRNASDLRNKKAINEELTVLRDN